jgi:hypothetical protein
MNNLSKTSNSDTPTSINADKGEKAFSQGQKRPLCPNRFYMGLFMTISGSLEAIYLYLSGCVQALASDWIRNLVLATVPSFLIFWITGGCILLIYGLLTSCPKYEYE